MNDTSATKSYTHLGYDWFSRYHPQTQLLRLVAVVGVLQQSLKPLQTAPNRSEPHKFKSWFQLAFAVAGGCGRIKKNYFFSKTI